LGGYVRVGPFTNGAGPGISKAFLDGVEAVLARPSGDTETGKYYLEFGQSGANYYTSDYISTISRTSVPVSVSINTATIAPTGLNSPATALLDSNGFEVKASATGNVSDGRVGGAWTVQY
jgi:hypothetical protein